MQNWRSVRRHLAKNVNMSHDVIATTLLLFGGNGKVFRCEAKVSFELGDGFVADWEPKFLFSFGEPKLEVTPGRISVLGGEKLEHFLACQLYALLVLYNGFGRDGGPTGIAAAERRLSCLVLSH